MPRGAGGCEGHLVQRVHTEHTCRCSRPARLEAGRAASSSPTMACMRCLGSSKQQVCCQAIHAGVWERWARRILATAVACVAPAGAGVVHGYQLESESSSATALSATGAKGGAIFTERSEFSLFTEVRATSATATDSTQYDFTRNQPAALVAAQSNQTRASPTRMHLPAPPSVDNTP